MEKLIKKIKDLFTLKEEKTVEVINSKEAVESRITELERQIDDISYQALIVENKAAIKEYDKLIEELEAAINDKELLEAKEKALKNYKIDEEAKKDAEKLYKEIQKEIDKAVKEYGAATKEYMDLIEQIEALSERIKELNKKIVYSLPSKLDAAIDLLDYEKLGLTEKDIQAFKENRSGSDKIRVFKDARSEAQDERFNSNNLYRIYNEIAQ